MDATTMEKITSLAKKLQSKAARSTHLHHLTLRQGEMFGWDHTACAITYNAAAPHAAAYLLHELGHALLKHTGYRYDIELLKMERAAWDKAITVASEYGVAIHEDVIEDALDSYRDWLHNRSLCPACGATGMQTAPGSYTCVACNTSWRVNEARTCALRRYRTKKRP